MTFAEQLQADIGRIESALERSLSRETGEGYDRIFEAVKYSAMAGGKRLRPVIVLAFCRLCGGDEEKALPFACALEMIHTYSLIHDDLPCMDNDDLRRGRPTCHRAFDEATAVLAGDGLLTAAFETAAAAEGLSAQTVLQCIRILGRAAGMNGMIGGQVLDMGAEHRRIPLEELRQWLLPRRYMGKSLAWRFRSGMIFWILRVMLQRSARRSARMRRMKNPPFHPCWDWKNAVRSWQS